MKHFVLMALVSVATSPLRLPHRDTASRITDYAKSHLFSGSIIVKSNGRRVFEANLGIANRAFNVPCNAKTKYRIASITKAFTSVLILQLVEKGKIDLNKPIREYLPSYIGEGASKVTIQQLLNHTSGIQNIDSNIKGFADAMSHGIPQYQMPSSSDELVSRFCSGKLVHEPGKVFDYSNGDYMILGKIIEHAYGTKFDNVLQKRILTPLGMRDSGICYQHLIIPNLAPTYYSVDRSEALINDIPQYPENWYAAGAMYSTSPDLMKFNDALYEGKLISFKSLELMLKPGLDGYGDGVWVGFPKFGGRQYRNVNRPGGIMGANGSLYHFNGVGFNRSINIVILSNTNRTSLDDFAWYIGKTLLD